MNKYLVVFSFVIVPILLNAKCECVHCGFEYLGADVGVGCLADAFMKESAVSEAEDRYCVKEYMLSYRRLNWYLYQLEVAGRNGDLVALSNAVRSVASLFHVDGNCGKGVPDSLKLQWMEKIEYCMARMVLSDARESVVPHLEILLPASLLDDTRTNRIARSVKTFKNMLLLGDRIENYRVDEQCCPVTLDSIDDLPEEMRKCAYGRDIEYEYYDGRWILRCRCDSWEGGLCFDEYLPFIYNQRKHLDLCFSMTYNEKRRELYSGNLFCAHDDRLSCSVIHDKTKSGVHKVKFRNASAGNFRIIPKSESVAQKLED